MNERKRQRILDALIEKYGFEVVNGWADLHCVTMLEDGSDWWLGEVDHELVMRVGSVRDGVGNWIGVKNETENWVYANADKMHDILWELADDACCTVWEFLERWGDLKDECSWVLESVLKREPIDYNFVRNIGWLVGNEITARYQSLTYDIDEKMEKSGVQQLFKKYLYNQSGMMCDQAFVECVWSDWVEEFSVDDLRRANTVMGVYYDGTFTVEMAENDVSGKDYVVIKVYPVTDEGNKTIDDCVCGEAWIQTEKWNDVMDILEE